LQAFQLAALESGSSVEQAQKGLEKFARSIGDAQRGLKTQQDIFKDLGVELSDVDGNTRDFNAILLDTADGLKGFGNETDRATALANLFGRAGIAMSEVFVDGADGIRQFTERAQGLGIIIPPQVISNVAKFNDQFAVLQLQLKAVVNNITGALAPALSVLVTDLSTLLKGTNDSAEGFDNLGQSIAISILEGVKVAATAIQAFINDAEQTFLTFAASAGGKFFGFELTEIQELQVKLVLQI
jgi:TP901 family phage tail tape measure protein